MKHPASHLSYILALVILYLPLPCFSSASPANSLSRGSSLSVEDESPDLVSPDGSFSCCLYKIGTNACTFSIWFSDSADNTTAWTANRDRPVNGQGSRIMFRKDGSVVLTDFDDAVVWGNNTSSTGAEQMKLLDSGNLVVGHADGKTVPWQSFDSPTDTLLPTQPITKNIKVVSSRARGCISSGYYGLYFDADNVLSMIYDGPDISSIYWPDPEPMITIYEKGRTNYNRSKHAVLGDEGKFVSRDGFSFNASDEGHGIREVSSQFRRFTYKDLERTADKFKDELGKGGSGSVYKWVLDDERVVAVKKLQDAIRGEEELWAEVSVIGRIYHMNLVRMWGFCSEGAHKLLVSEFVDNGSLDKFLFDGRGNATSVLGWRERYKIAVGVVKGLAYLHHECLEWVIHCDVKPENILLN